MPTNFVRCLEVSAIHRLFSIEERHSYMANRSVAWRCPLFAGFTVLKFPPQKNPYSGENEISITSAEYDTSEDGTFRPQQLGEILTVPQDMINKTEVSVVRKERVKISLSLSKSKVDILANYHKF